MPVYSFGEDSPLKFEISDNLAENYNAAVEAFFKAQRRFAQRFGRKWDPEVDPIALRWTRRQKRAWNEFAKVLAAHVENDGRYFPNDIMDDFLVRNTADIVSAVSQRYDRALTLAVGVSVAHVLLRGL